MKVIRISRQQLGVWLSSPDCGTLGRKDICCPNETNRNKRNSGAVFVVATRVAAAQAAATENLKVEDEKTK